MSTERSCLFPYTTDSDEDTEDDEICYIRDHRKANNGTMELLIVWTKGNREWSNIKNVRKDCPNLLNKYISDKGIVLEPSTMKKKISISKMLTVNEYGENEDMCV